MSLFSLGKEQQEERHDNSLPAHKYLLQWAEKVGSCPLHSPEVEEEIISLICNKNDIAKH